MDQKFRDARQEKIELEEHYASSQQQSPQQDTPEAGPSASASAPPAYAPPPSSDVSSLPTCGVSVFKVFESIKGSWLLDPLAPRSSDPSLKLLHGLVENRAGRRIYNLTLGTPTAKLDSWRGNISATLRVVGESPAPETATIRSTSHNGHIVLELVSKAPSRAVHFDAHSLSGNVSLLIPRNFSGIVELRGRRGNIELLPALMAYAQVQRASHSETVVLIGNGAPTPGVTTVDDFARLYSGSGRLRLGFSGEDSFTESGSLIGKIIQRFTG